MPWFSSARERLGEVDHAQVVQHLGDEARVEQVQDRVRDAADVLVDGRPLSRLRRVERHVGSRGSTGSAGSTTRSRRTCPSCRCRASPGSPQLGHGDVDPVLAAAERRRALGREVEAVGRRQADRQLVVGHGDLAARRAVDDRDRRAPVALARDQPVAQAVVDRAPVPGPRSSQRSRSMARRSPRPCAARPSGPELISRAVARVGRRRRLDRTGGAVARSAASTTTRTGRSNARAKSRSRWSCAGTAMIAPWP